MGKASVLSTGAAIAAVPSSPSLLQMATRRFLQQRGATFGLALLLSLGVIAVAAPLVAPHDPLAVNKEGALQAPSGQFWFGTDELGRDILSRVLHASRLSLGLGLAAVLLAALIGVPLGLVAGYLMGWVDTVVMRAVDCMLAFPPVLLAMVVVAVLGPGSANVMLAVALASAPTFARLARAHTLAQKERDYVLAALALGASTPRILTRGILPNVLAPILVQISLSLGYAMLLEAALSFLGLGTQPPDASWGAMLNVGRGHMLRAPWYVIFPGLAITLTILAINAVTEGLNRALAPERPRQ